MFTGNFGSHSNTNFHTLIFEQQSTESACWLALTRAPRVLLAGDHFQLPPTIISPEAERKGLSLTLMERIINRKEDGNLCVRMLTTQYRMHRDIMQWASNQLYHGKLEAHPSVASHLLMELPGVEENEDTGTHFKCLLKPHIKKNEGDLHEDCR